MRSEFEAMRRLFNVAWGREETDYERLAIYSELVYNRFEDFVMTSFPLFTSFVEDDIREILKEFVRREHRSPLLMDVGNEFLNFFVSLKHPVKERLPFLEELLLLEWLEIEIFNVNDDMSDTDFHWHGRYRLHKSSCLSRFSYPVHRAEELSAEEIIEGKGRYNLLIFRDREDTVRKVELTDFVYDYLCLIGLKWSPMEALKCFDVDEEVKPYLERFFRDLLFQYVFIRSS